jgi:acyl carrier protein
MIEKKIKEIVSEIADIDDDLDSIEGLVTNGFLDSFAVLLLVDSLEKTFDIVLEIDDQFIEQIDTIASIVNIVERCQKVA